MIRLNVSWFCLAAMLLFLANAAAGEETLNPDLPCQATKSKPVSYDVDFSVVVTPPCHAKVLKVWLPLPQTDAAQEVTEGDISTFPAKVTPRIGQEKVFGNKFAYFEFDHPEGAQLIRHTFKIKVWELRWNLDPGRVARVEKWPASFDRYLRNENQAVVISDQVKQVAGKIRPGRPDAGRDVSLVMNWVIDNMKYDHRKCSLQASSEFALTNMTGHCSDYHGLCASLGRSLGYPTRVTYGINPFPKNSPSHCKLEVFLPPYGWVSFDVSETQRVIADIKKDASLDERKKEALVRLATDRLQRGFRDNTWFLQTRGTDYDLVPPATKRVPVVRTIYAEADGVALRDPDPGNSEQREFAWMTVCKFTPDRTVVYPFQNWKALVESERK